MVPRFLIVFLTLLLLTTCARASAQEPIFIGRFLEQREEWPKMVEEQTLLRLEGRVELSGPTRLKYLNVDLRFIAGNSSKLPPIVRRSKYLEVHGKLSILEDQLTFLIDDVRQRSPDLERFQQREQELRGEDPTPMYQLARWGMERARFYEDETLLKASRQLAQRGIQWDRAQAIRGPLQGWRDLSALAAEFELSPELQESILHEGYVLFRKHTQIKKQPATRAQLQQMSEELFGCLDPLKPPQPNLRLRYLEDPLEVYAAIEPPLRAKLHRVLYSELLLDHFRQELKEDFSNGYAIAAKIDQELPEFYELADDYRVRELTWQRSRLKGLPQPLVVELSERYRQRNQPEEARKILEDWVQHQEKNLKADRPDELLRIAWLYRSLLEDSESEAKLLLKAYRLNPDSKEISTRLLQLGYRQVDGQWLSEQQQKSREEDPVLVAIREGRVLVGMTPEQVRRAQGKPLSISRLVTAGQVTELWTYGEPGQTQYIISIRRSTRSGEAEVTNIVTLDALPPVIPQSPE